MNDNAKKWVAALRSGDWKQGHFRLQRCNGEDQFCCLGVAVRLYMEEHPGALTEERERDRIRAASVGAYVRFALPGGGAWANDLPTPVREWLGLDSSNGAYYTVSRVTVAHSLASDNDQGQTFEQIADIIESEPEGLFVD